MANQTRRGRATSPKKKALSLSFSADTFDIVSAMPNQTFFIEMLVAGTSVGRKKHFKAPEGRKYPKVMRLGEEIFNILKRSPDGSAYVNHLVNKAFREAGSLDILKKWAQIKLDEFKESKKPKKKPFPTMAGDAINALRVAKGLTQVELATMTGTHQTYLAALENSSRRLSLKMAKRLAEALGCEAEDFLKPPGLEEDTEEMISPEELAQMHDVSLQTAQRWCREKRLKCIKKVNHYRVSKAAAENFVPPVSTPPRRDKCICYAGELIKKLRLQKGYSQSDLARQSDVSNNHISKLENNKNKISKHIAEKLAKALGCKTERLLGE